MQSEGEGRDWKEIWKLIRGLKHLSFLDGTLNTTFSLFSPCLRKHEISWILATDSNGYKDFFLLHRYFAKEPHFIVYYSQKKIYKFVFESTRILEHFILYCQKHTNSTTMFHPI